jgi:hypothetical protein
MRPLLFAALLSATPVFAQDTGQSTDITGAYAVEGRNIDGSAYNGDLTLSTRGNRYLGSWLIAGQAFRGSGDLEGRILTLQWEEGTAPVIYVLMPDGELHGTWADGRALERAMPLD